MAKVISSCVLAALSALAWLHRPAEVAPAAAAAPTLLAAPMAVDQMHSSLMFQIKHADVANFYGAFKKVSGTVHIDDANLKESSVTIEVDADSVDSRDEGRDRHLKSQDFLDVKQFPTISFKSKSVAKNDAVYEIAGDVTLHGVTKPVTIQARLTGAGQVSERMGYRAGFETNFSINRSDFGMKYGIEHKTLGDEVRLLVSLECVPQK